MFIDVVKPYDSAEFFQKFDDFFISLVFRSGVTDLLKLCHFLQCVKSVWYVADKVQHGISS